jgi:AraC-like DNA-binding protein
MGFNDFINSFRIKEAMVQLNEVDQGQKMLDLAYEVGFSSKSAFNAAFKKFTGKTPTQFKRRRLLRNRQK